MTNKREDRNRVALLEANRLYRQVVSVLNRLGFAKTVKGVHYGISFDAVEVVRTSNGEPAMITMSVDTANLPPKVSVTDLKSNRTLKTLEAATGLQVGFLNTTKLVYVFRLLSDDGGTSVLPKTIALTDVEGSGDTRELMVPLGLGFGGEIWDSLVSLGHILIGGSTRNGKSRWIQTALCWLVENTPPEKLQIVIADMKVVEFALWENVKHVVTPVVLDVENIGLLLTWLSDEIDRRAELFTKARVRNWESYSRRTGEQLPIVLAILDEVADVVLELGKSSPEYRQLIRVAQKGRGFGIVLWMSLQNPKADVLGTLIRAQMLTRICFHVPERAQSMVILNRSGAEKLPGDVPGRAELRLPQTGYRLHMVQMPFVDDEEIEQVIQKHWTDEEKVWPDSVQTEHGETWKLTKRQALMVQVAYERLDSAFPVGRLAQLVEKEYGIKHHEVQAAGEQLGELGLLTEPRSANESRMLTDTLIDAAFELLNDEVE